MSGKIQVGYLVSYDYELLKNSLPTVYKDSDTIFLAIDKNRKTWKGDEIVINPTFFTWLSTFDSENKVVLYEEEFYVSSLTTMECEVRERKMLAQKMGIGNWLIQIDADEYFYDFAKFVGYLKSKNKFLINPQREIIQICCFKINLYKYVEGGVLYVDQLDKFMVATNYPNYKVGRNGKCRSIYVNSISLHDCLSRSRIELEQKLDNWGHNNDINKEEFLKKWDKVNSTNYKSMRGFFYLNPMGWKTIDFMKGNSLNELLINFKSIDTVKITNFFLIRKNFGQWFKFLFK